MPTLADMMGRPHPPIPDASQMASRPLNATEQTPLTPAEEQQFQKWVVASGIRDLDEADSFYDYRGLFKALKGKPVPMSAGRHFPDTFKQHGHPTFSVESQYSAGPLDGGRWNNADQYVTPAQTVQNMMTLAQFGPR